MRLLVTGASGLLGRSFMRIVKTRADLTVMGTAFSRPAHPLVRVDLTDDDEVSELFAMFMPDLVLHAAAERRPDIVDIDPDRARVLNVGVTERIARLCDEFGAHLIYISTDYVFDGSAPPYLPDSPTNPLNAYGAMKLEGEQAARAILGADGSRFSVLRIPLLYGPVEHLGECSVTELARAAAKTAPVTVEHWATRWPIHVDDVSRAILAIIDAPASLGIYQLSGPVGYTKYEMATEMARILRDTGSVPAADPALLVPNPKEPSGAPRPKDCRMDVSRLQALGWSARVPFNEGVAAAILPHFRTA